LTSFAESVGESTTASTRTLGDLFAVPRFKDLVLAIGFLPQDSTISDARLLIRSIPSCNDIFVTPTGDRDDRAIGWITNTLLAGVK
jgi:hypothetical protein